MIHYNPELHHDKLVKYIVESLLAKEELDQPLMPPQNNGNTVFALYDGEETYLFFSQEEGQKLYSDAYKLYFETIGMQEENKSIYDLDTKVAEVNDKGDMGIVLSKGDMKVALTSEDCYSTKLIKEETESRVYTAVVKRQIKFFDPQGIGFIPSFDTILGVYEDMCDAIDDVYDTLCSKNRRMETGKNNPIVDKNGNTVGFDYIFRYEDKETGASAFYEIEIKEQIITPKRNKQSHP